MPGRSQNWEIGTLLPPAFLLFCVRAYRIFKDEEVLATPRTSSPFDGDNAVSPDNPLLKRYLPLEFP